MGAKKISFMRGLFDFLLKYILIEILIAVVAGLIVAIITQAQPFAPPSANKVLDLPGNAAWVPTGVHVRIGQSVLVTASGVMNMGGEPEAITDPNGKGGTICDRATFEQLANVKFPMDCLMTGTLIGTIIGRLGNDGKPFPIGSSYQFTSGESAELFLAVNDCCEFPDNLGKYSVTIFLQ